MHEIGVVRSMVKTVTDFAEQNDIKEDAEIVLDIGELSLVIPKYVEDIYPVVVGYMAQGHKACDKCHSRHG